MVRGTVLIGRKNRFLAGRVIVGGLRSRIVNPALMGAVVCRMAAAAGGSCGMKTMAAGLCLNSHQRANQPEHHRKSYPCRFHDRTLSKNL